MLSLAVANDYEMHVCDIEQVFLQADKLTEGVNGRHFIQPPPGSPDANDRDVVYESTATMSNLSRHSLLDFKGQMKLK